MSRYAQIRIVPKFGNVLVVVIVARISTVNQDMLSLDDQIAKVKAYVESFFDGPIKWIIIQSQGSGENLERKELTELEELIESGKVDLVIAEDLARICRRRRAYDFCELCRDHNARLIAINDGVDTGVEGWEDTAFISTWHHERSNRDTSKRIRRSHRNRFMQGGVFQFEIYGYIKKLGAKSDADVEKDPAAEEVYREWFRRLDAGATYAEIADWLNSKEIPVGRHSDGIEWTGPMVGRVSHNTLLKGVRQRNKKMSYRNKNGKRRSVDAPPEELLERRCPHLAFFDEEYYDRVIAKADKSNEMYRRKGDDGVDHRKGVSKKRTTWPGQHLRCGVCNRIFHWSGVRIRKCMKCSGSHIYRCWNGIEVNGELLTRKLAEAILAEIMSLPDFDQEFLSKFRDEWSQHRQVLQSQKEEKQKRLRDSRQQIDRVTEAIAKSGFSEALQLKLKSLEEQTKQFAFELKELEQKELPEPALPSMTAIKQAAERIFPDLAADDPEVGRLMKLLVPDLAVFPYRICDGGSVVLRAKATLYLPALMPAPALQIPGSIFERTLTIDLFDLPQRVKHREEILALHDRGLTTRAIAAQLGIKQATVQKSLGLSKSMEEQGLTDPFVLLTEATTACGLPPASPSSLSIRTAASALARRESVISNYRQPEGLRGTSCRGGLFASINLDEELS